MMGLMDWFSVKTPAQRKKEEKIYARWVFPHGLEQRDILQSILKELVPEESPEMALTIYLLGREGYQGNDMEEREELIEQGREARLTAAYWKMRSQLPRRFRGYISRYLALIEADDKIEGELNYPTVAELLEAAAELDKML